MFQYFRALSVTLSEVFSWRGRAEIVFGCVKWREEVMEC